MILRIIFLLCAASVFATDEPQPRSYVSSESISNLVIDFDESSELREKTLPLLKIGFAKFDSHAQINNIYAHSGEAVDKGEVVAINSMLHENPYALVVAFESVENTSDIDLTALKREYNYFKQILTGESLDAIKKYQIKIDNDHQKKKNGLCEAVTDYEERDIALINQTKEQKAKIVAAIINPESGLVKWMRYNKSPARDIRALSSDLRNEIKPTPLPQLPENLDDLVNGSFDRIMNEYIEKVEDPQRAILLARKSLGQITQITPSRAR